MALVAALASDVELLVLDEPTSGLDPLMEAVFQDTIREIAADGRRTVLLSSHILAEVEALCDRVSIIRLGRTVESGTLAELRHLTRTSVTVETDEPLDGLADLPGVHDLEVDGTRASFDVDTAQLDDAVRLLATQGVRSLVSQPPTLEELFLRHYGDELADLEGVATSGDGQRGRAMTSRRHRQARPVRCCGSTACGWPVWIAGIVWLVWVTAVSVKGLYPTQADLEAAAAAAAGQPGGHRPQRPHLRDRHHRRPDRRSRSAASATSSWR